METTDERIVTRELEAAEEFNPTRTYAVLLLLLAFIGSSFYVLIDSYV